MDTNRSRRGAGVHVYNPHLLDKRSTSSNVRKAGALVPPSSCLDGEPHGWVPVDTHSTPVLTSVRRLWVAYVVQEPSTPQEHAQPAQMSKRTQEESGEERVTAKSRPMMSLIARSIERPPSALSSTASESSGKTRQESQSSL